MAKRSGLGQRLFVGGFDLSGDALALNNISGSINLLDMTGVNKSAHERIPGERDGSLSATTAFNTATGQEHPTLKTLPRTDVHLMYAMSATIADDAFCIVSKQTNYDPTRAADGMFTFNTDTVGSSFGADWCLMCTAGLRTDSAAVTGTGVSFSTASPAATGTTANGFQAYLQVTAFSGTNITMHLEHSSDNGVGDPFATLTSGTFTQVTAAPATERLVSSSSLSVKKWIRVVTAGTFSSCTFAVAVDRNESQVLF